MAQRRLRNYSGLDKSYAEWYAPETIADLSKLLERASLARRQVTFRGGGYSFDAQALNNDVVIGLHKLNRIEPIDRHKGQITVGPGVRWREIVRATRPCGLTPYVVVTTGETTAGGTLSANCFSRSSPRYGKEGAHVDRFQLLTPTGQLLICNRATHPELFHAVIGGFGYLGVVTEITYNLLPIGKRTQVQTVVSKFPTLEAYVAGLQQQTRHSQDWDAVYSLLLLDGDECRGLVCRSRYVADTALKPFPVYQTKSLAHAPLEWLMGIPRVNKLILKAAYHYLREGEQFVDRLEGYTFFMEGHRKTKDLASRLGVSLPTVQQTLVVPESHLLRFLQLVVGQLRASGLAPSMLDVLFLPADTFLLSANNGLGGYAVSLAFERLSSGHLQNLQALLARLSSACAEHGGRVHLIKNVYASSQTIAQMYEPSINIFLALKQRVDPNCIVRNSFFDRIFGQALQGSVVV
jgi:decaprenylphospho-beta-D-ribofuranose 2-oxidase